MKRLSIILFVLAFALAGCAGIQIKPPDIDQIISTGPKLVGALIAENNPDYVDTILKYGDMLLAQDEPLDFKGKLDEGVEWLLKQYLDKASIRVLIIDCLPDIEIQTTEIPTPAWMDKVKPVVKAFMDGVRLAAPVTSKNKTGVIQRYYDIYEANYFKLLIQRGLP